MIFHVPSLRVLSDTAIVVGSHLFEDHSTEWQALMDWCRLHGLDPHRMPAAQMIVRNLELCRVEYDEYLVTDDGLRDRALRWRDYDGEPYRRRVHAQGETPPMPFPDVILAHLRPARETA